MPTRPITGPLTRSLSGGVTGVGVGVALSAFSAAKFAIQQDSADVNILVIGDSTGDASDEWVHLFAAHIGNEYPTHSVKIRGYTNFTTPPGSYGPDVSISVGSGVNTIRFYNASISGTKPSEWVGLHLDTAITSIPVPSVVIWNHGHNIITAYAEPIIRGSFASAMAAIRAALPGVPFAAVLQNPWRDDASQYPKTLALTEVAGRIGGCGTLDFYSRWIAAGKPAGWYLDNIHPNATGSAENADVAITAWRAAPPLDGFVVPAAWMDSASQNILANGDFSNWTGTYPESWSPVAGATTCTKDTVVKDADQAYSLRMAYDTRGDIRQDLSTAQRAALAGKKITLAVRVAIDPAQPARPVPGFSLLVGAPSTGNVTYSSGNALSWERAKAGQFVWGFLVGVDVPSDVNLIRATMMIGSGNTTGDFINIQRAVLVEGSVPMDMA